MLAVLEVRLELVQPQRRRAAKPCVVTVDLKLGQHVAHNAGNGPQVRERHNRAVNGANLLLGEPLGYASVAEGMFAVWRLESRWTRGITHA